MSGNEIGWLAVVGEGDRKQELKVRWLSAASCLGGVAWLNIGYAGLSPEIRLGTPVCLKHENSEKIKLVVVGSDPSQGWIRASHADHLTQLSENTQQHRWSLFQRIEGESIWDVLRSVTSDDDKLLASEINEADIDIEKLNQACPVGWCMAVPERLPLPVKLTHAIKNIVLASNGLVAGLVRTISQIEARTAGVYFDEGSISAKRCLTLSDKWNFAPNKVTSTKERRTRIQRDLRVTNPTSYMEQLFDPDVRIFSGDEIGDTELIPVAPVSIKAGELQWFAESVVTRIDFDASSEGDHNFAVTLDLVEAFSWVPSIRTGGRVLLVGEVEEKSGDDKHTIGIVSPPENLFGPLTEWKLGNIDMLLIYEAAPGFVREEQSAFLARWKKGDRVLFYVDAQGSAVILGALGKPQTEEDGNPNVHLMGDLLRISVTDKVEVEKE